MAEPGYGWNDKAGRYIAPSGRFVSQRSVQQALYKATDNSARVMRGVSQQLRDGKVSLREWQTVMRQEVKNVHLYSATAVKGGWAQMGPSDYGRVGQRIKEQYKFLDNFAADLASGKQKIDGRFIQRATMYGDSGRQTSHLFERVEKLDRGYTEERSILVPGNNCDECIEEDARGWVEIGSLTPIGSRTCLSRCACGVIYR